MKIYRIYILLFITAFLLTACATVVPPDGGAKDTTPPVALNYSPKNKVRNYNGDRIVIKFDEYIQLKDLQSQLVVSPAMPEDPEVFLKGKKLIIQPPDSLEPNTTYTIFLGNSVVNYTEGLPIRNFQFVLSTGEHLDSLRIKGVVRNAYDLKTEEGILVMLYKKTNDSVPYIERPYYIAKTFGQGEFILDNLSAGKYLIFGLKDLNSNYLYDQPSEEIAFLDSLIIPAPVKPDDDSLNLITPVILEMQLFKEIEKVQGLLNHKVLNPKAVQFAFRRNAGDVLFSLIDSQEVNDWYYPVFSNEKDTVKLWITADLPDTIRVKIYDKSSIIDTVRLVLKKPSRNRDIGRIRRNTESLNDQDSIKKNIIERLNISTNASQSLDFFNSPVLIFNTPVKNFDAKKISLYKIQDSLKIPILIEAEFIDKGAANLLVLKSKLEEASTYKIFFPDSVFYDIFGNTNDTGIFQFSTTKARSYGSLSLVVESKDSLPLIIQLLNDKDAVIQQDILVDSLIMYPYLKPGNYKIKAISDINKNGKWDTGDYLNKTLPERVFYLKQPISLRANWDVEHKWIIE